jgi:hypothetical protein
MKSNRTDNPIRKELVLQMSNNQQPTNFIPYLKDVEINQLKLITRTSQLVLIHSHSDHCSKFFSIVTGL